MTWSQGKEWLCVGGDQKGQTQVDYPQDDMVVWNHPIDVHYYTKSMQGWPKICLEVWKLDEYGGQQVCGYGFAFLPTESGYHEMSVPVWRPCGSHKDEVVNFSKTEPNTRCIVSFSKDTNAHRSLCTSYL